MAIFALIFEKLIKIAKYYDWESIFRGSLDTINNNGIAYINLDEIKTFGKNVITNDSGIILITDNAEV